MVWTSAFEWVQGHSGVSWQRCGPTRPPLLFNIGYGLDHRSEGGKRWFRSSWVAMSNGRENCERLMFLFVPVFAYLRLAGCAASLQLLIPVSRDGTCNGAVHCPLIRTSTGRSLSSHVSLLTPFQSFSVSCNMSYVLRSPVHRYEHWTKALHGPYACRPLCLPSVNLIIFPVEVEILTAIAYDYSKQYTFLWLLYGVWPGWTSTLVLTFSNEVCPTSTHTISIHISGE